MLIFEQSVANRQAHAQSPGRTNPPESIPLALKRKQLPRWPTCSELQVVRHYTRLSQRNFSIDTSSYPLGSCTMKYNPRGVHVAASLRGFTMQHPLNDEESNQGTLEALYRLQQYLIDITGMAAVSLTPMAGSQGEWSGVAMIKAYHQARGDITRCDMLIPDAAHGTNPASASMCGFNIIEIHTTPDGDLDLDELCQHLGPTTAGMMLTNPSTLGLFIRNIEEIASMIHGAGGLLYYDGANLNAILGQVKPGNMGFDVMHLNLHKTFATPHGGGGPGAGPVAVGEKLKPYLPLPIVIQQHQTFAWAKVQDYPASIGRLSCFMGNVGVLLRAYFYIRLLGQAGLTRVANHATLNANYLQRQLMALGYSTPYPTRRASHEFVLSLSPQKKQYDVRALDVAKRLLDFGIHAPTIYFPQLVNECLLIEPTETECKQDLDRFIWAMQCILHECQHDPLMLKNAPHDLTIKRVDELKAARELNLNYFTLPLVKNEKIRND